MESESFEPSANMTPLRLLKADVVIDYPGLHRRTRADKTYRLMLLKVFFFAIIIYFVLRTTARLIHAMKSGGESSRLDREPAQGWTADRASRPYREEDVEDAKFVDVN